LENAWRKERQKKHAVTCWFHADLIVFLFQATNHEAVQDVAVGDLVRFRFGNEVRQGEMVVAQEDLV
jgi:hypothetical protein